MSLSRHISVSVRKLWNKQCRKRKLLNSITFLYHKGLITTSLNINQNRNFMKLGPINKCWKQPENNIQYFILFLNCASIPFKTFFRIYSWGRSSWSHLHGAPERNPHGARHGQVETISSRFQPVAAYFILLNSFSELWWDCGNCWVSACELLHSGTSS